MASKGQQPVIGKPAKLPPPGQPRTPGRLLGVGGVAAWLGVTPELVTKWLLRYPWDGDDTPVPAPDYVVVPGRRGGDSADPVWADTAQRRAEWKTWQESRPSQGRPGQPKPRKTTAA